jgi:hypothetical protein
LLKADFFAASASPRLTHAFHLVNGDRLLRQGHFPATLFVACQAAQLRVWEAAEHHGIIILNGFSMADTLARFLATYRGRASVIQHPSDWSAMAYLTNYLIR